MSITREEVMHVAALSRLSLTEEESARMQCELDEMLAYMKQLESETVGADAPSSGAQMLDTVGREDTVAPSLPRESLLAAAPAQDGRYLVVPKALE